MARLQQRASKGVAILMLAAAASTAAAQTPRPWVDPPVAPFQDTAAPEPPSPPQPIEPPRAAPGAAAHLRQTPESVARDVMIEYLAFWSAPSSIALGATRELYAPEVRFHGRYRSARALLDEKRRFVRRWPERSYRPRLETLKADCNANGNSCIVRSVFDFTASHPDRRRRATGTAVLELGISLLGLKAVIVSENSLVSRRGPSDRTALVKSSPY